MESTPHRLDEIQGQAQKAFARANPEIWNKIQGDPTKIGQVAEIQTRTHVIIQRFRSHVKRHRQNWVIREMDKIFEERERQGLDYFAPGWALDQPVHESYIETARLRVEQCIQGRLTRITEAGKTMQARIADRRVFTPADKTLGKKVNRAIGRTQKVRDKARAHYRMNRDLWIQKAIERGSKSPMRDVTQRQQERMNHINEAGERLMYQVFKEHGQTLPQQKEKTHTQDFAQSMG